MTEERISTYWSKFFGIEKESLSKPGLIVVPHNYLEEYQGAWIFKRNKRIIISVQPKELENTTQRTTRLEYEELNVFSRSTLDYIFGKNIERIIGPVYQGYYDNANTLIKISEAVQEINFKEHQEQIAQLSKSGDKDGWSNSSINNKAHGMYGYFHKGRIESISSYRLIRGNVAFIGVFTNPKFRGLNFSHEVMKKIVMDLTKRNILIRYQTLTSNKPSVRLAEKIGFNEFARNVAIRFKNRYSSSE